MRHALAGEFHGAVQRAVHADEPDDMQHHVLAAHPLSRPAGKVEAYGGGNLEPVFPRGHAHGEIGAAHARGKGPQRSVGAGVRVAADDHLARSHDALFRQKGVFYAHAAHVEEVGQFVFTGEFAAYLALHGRLDVLVRREVVEHHDDLVLVEHPVGPGLAEFRDGQRDGDVVAHHHVELRLDELACGDALQPRMCGQYLLCYGHAHRDILIIKEENVFSCTGRCRQKVLSG